MFFMFTLFMFYCGVLSFFYTKIHFLKMLISLEFISLTMVFMVINGLMFLNYDLIVLIYMLVMMVCEAVLGLLLLTLIVRTHGSDYMKFSGVMMC